MSLIRNSVLDISRYCAITAATIGPFSAAVMSVSTIAILVTCLLSGKLHKILEEGISHPVGKALSVFFLVLWAGVLYSPVDFEQAASNIWNWRKIFYIVIFLGLFQPESWKKRFIMFYLAGMSVAVFLSYLAWFDLIPSKREPGILATNYTVQSMAFIVATVCCIMKLKETKEITQKYCWVVLIILFSVNILFISASRSGYIAFFVAVVGMVIGSYGKRIIYQLALGVVLIVGIAISTSEVLQNRVTKGIDELKTYEQTAELTSIGARVVFMKNTLQMIKENPWIGYGTGAFYTVYKQHIANKYNDWRSTPTGDPHNQYLFIMTENGLIGLGVFLWFLVIALKQGFSTDQYAVIGGSVLLAWVVTSLFNSHFTTFLEGHLLGLLVGVMLARESENKTEIC